jgi:hypothetical protein
VPVPVSVSIFSNIPDSDKSILLIDEFIQTILKISQKSKSINQFNYANIAEI